MDHEMIVRTNNFCILHFFPPPKQFPPQCLSDVRRVLAGEFCLSKRTNNTKKWQGLSVLPYVSVHFVFLTMSTGESWLRLRLSSQPNKAQIINFRRTVTDNGLV